MSRIKNALKGIVAKAGYQTDRHIVVFESDDWGAIRVPNKDSLDQFKEAFPQRKLDHYQSFDGLERLSDVEGLSGVLRRSSELFSLSEPVFTLNFATANPRFDRCSPGDMAHACYEFESIDETYRAYGEGDSVLSYINRGREETALHPQLHGREHLNATAWLAACEVDPAVEFARSLRMVGVDDAFYCDIDALNTNNVLVGNEGYLRDAVALFDRIFGFAPKSFIPPCYVADRDSERALSCLGVETIQSSPLRNIPKKDGTYSKRISVFGRLGSKGLCRLVRNVQFEPARYYYNDEQAEVCITQALNGFKAAFDRNQPAVVCTHRVNFCSRVEEAHCEYSLDALGELLYRLSLMYPDCEFMTSDQLGSLILDLNVENGERW